MTRSLAAVIAIFAGLAPAMALAQTNLDKGKTPGQIFASDCAACHKAARGLAKGRDSSALTEFLREHYTTSREQAAGLAAYVLRGGVESAGSAEKGQKPSTEHARASAEEPKPGRPGRQPAKPEVKPEAKPESKPENKPEGTPAATAKLQPPAGSEDVKPAEVKPAEEKPPEEAVPAAGPGPAEPPAIATEPRTPPPPPRTPAARQKMEKIDKRMATRGHRKEGVTAAPTPAPELPAVFAEPSSAAMQNSHAGETPTAAAPPETTPGETAPVPRDNIPD